MIEVSIQQQIHINHEVFLFLRQLLDNIHLVFLLSLRYFYDDAKRGMDELTQKVHRLE